MISRLQSAVHNFKSLTISHYWRPWIEDHELKTINLMEPNTSLWSTTDEQTRLKQLALNNPLNTLNVQSERVSESKLWTDLILLGNKFHLAFLSVHTPVKALLHETFLTLMKSHKEDFSMKDLQWGIFNERCSLKDVRTMKFIEISNAALNEASSISCPIKNITLEYSYSARPENQRI